jgi:NAD-dependent DNA ligase
LNEREKDRYKDNLNPWKREKVSSEFLKPDFQNANSTTIFYMSKVVITGVFQGFQRNEIAQLLKQMGADIDTSVTSKTNYLLAGQGMGPSKREKAEKLGVRILNEQEFITLING